MNVVGTKELNMDVVDLITIFGGFVTVAAILWSWYQVWEWMHQLSK